MKTNDQLPHLAALIALGAIFLWLRGPVFAQQPPAMDSRPTLLELSAGNYSYSTKADLLHDGGVGGVAIQHAEISLSGRHEFPPGLQLAYGLGYDTNLLSADATVPLPDTLAVFSVNLGLIRTISSNWTAALFARPGFYCDFEHLGLRSLDAPVVVTASYAPTREFVWTFALSIDRFARNSVLPVLGVRWQAARDWNIEFGFPRTGFTWQAKDRLAMRAEAVYRSDSYRVAHTPAAVGAPGDTLLDFREIRAGAGLDFKLDGATTLSFDAGVATGRRFDYHERNYRLNGEDAGYLKLAFSHHF